MPKLNPTKVPASPSRPIAGSSSDLCTACGLCCNGALYRAAILDFDEVPAARALGLDIIEGEKMRFAQPCRRFENHICTIYPDRPRACRRYRCKVLRALDAEEITFEDAISKVRTAKAFVAEVEALKPPEMILTEARTIALETATDSGPGTEPGTRAAEMRLKLAATALNLYLDRNFRKSSEGRQLDLNPIEGPGETKG